MASLGRFISKFGERALPFFKIMKRTGPFKWTPEAAAAFEDLKRYLASPPIMVAPRPREPLKLYLAATPQTASAVLVAEREEPVLAKQKSASPSPELLDKEAPSSSLQPPDKPPQVGPEENLTKDSTEPREEPTAITSASTLVEHPM